VWFRETWYTQLHRKIATHKVIVIVTTFTFQHGKVVETNSKNVLIHA
jgi:hypothetical protein